jgi:hypothetical protein
VRKTLWEEQEFFENSGLKALIERSGEVSLRTSSESIDSRQMEEAASFGDARSEKASNFPSGDHERRPADHRNSS